MTIHLISDKLCVVEANDQVYVIDSKKSRYTKILKALKPTDGVNFFATIEDIVVEDNALINKVLRAIRF